MKMTKKLVMAAAMISSLAVMADTYTWSAASDGLFETLENWTLASTGGAPSALPGASDAVVIPALDAGYTVTVNDPLNIGSLVVGGAGGTATATVCFKNGGAETNEVAGSVTVGQNGELTHTQLPSTANATVATLSSNVPYKLNLRAGGNVTVASGGKISADGRGFYAGKGPFAADSGGKAGAAHGGTGRAQSTKNLNAYGSIRNPVDPGSGGQNGTVGAGGVICVIAGGSLVVDGTVSAVTSSGYASGGSVLLKAAAVSVSGTVSVKGGSAGGGGGRIAIYTNENKGFSSLGGTITAAGGNSNYATCGSIYFESALHAPGCGELVYDGKNQSCARCSYLNENVRDHQAPFGTVTVKGGAKFCIGSGAVLTVANGLDVAASAKVGSTTYYSRLFTAASTAGIHFAPAAGTTFIQSGAVETNHNFTCSAPGASVKFTSGSSMYIAANGTLNLSGATGNPLVLSTSDGTGSWALNVGSGSSISVANVDVSRCDSSGGLTITADNSVGDVYSKEHNWLFPETVKSGDLLRWIGEEDTSWGNANNWLDKTDGHRAPKETDTITILAGRPHYPRIIADTYVNTLTNAAGASITLANANLIVTNCFVSMGTVSRANTEQLILAGEGDATLDFANGEYGDVHITKSGGIVTLPNGLSAKRLKVTSSAATTFVLPATQKLKMDVFDIDGTSNDYITLASSMPGTAWRLEVADVMRVRGVAVSDSNASDGRTIAAGDFATNGGGNTNWDFASGSAVEWVGGVDNNWTTEGNWSPAGVPGEVAVVAIRPKTAAVSVVLAPSEVIVPVGGLILGGSDYAATLQCNKAIDVAGGVDVAENATLVLNSIATNNIVNCGFIVRRGAKVTHSGPQATDTQLYGVNLEVHGDMVIEASASVSANDNGYASGRGPGAGTGNSYAPDGASHGGAGKFCSDSKCYGSVFRPTTMGSPSKNASESGGQIAIAVDGTLTVNGSVSANGSNGSGGSVWLTAGTLKGGGSISANGAGAQSGSGGGRIAIYETVATDWSGFSGSVSATADKDRNGHGTIYYQTAADEPRGGQIQIKGKESAATGITPLPMADDGPARNAYAKDSIEVSGATLSITENMAVSDLNLIGTAGMVSITGRTLRVISHAHKNGRGWGDEYSALVKSGDGGKVVWSEGMFIILR